MSRHLSTKSSSEVELLGRLCQAHSANLVRLEVMQSFLDAAVIFMKQRHTSTFIQAVTISQWEAISYSLHVEGAIQTGVMYMSQQGSLGVGCARMSNLRCRTREVISCAATRFHR